MPQEVGPWQQQGRRVIGLSFEAERGVMATNSDGALSERLFPSVERSKKMSSKDWNLVVERNLDRFIPDHQGKIRAHAVADL
jgi:hypothetical protein